jgi:uncharacterized protein YbaP (TraB family)
MLNKLLPLASILLCLAAASCKKESPGEKTPAPEAKIEATANHETAANDEAATPTDEVAPEPSAETATDGVAVIENPFFYTVAGPNGESGFLLGTMHMGVDAAKELPKDVWLALASASSLTIEADITDVKVAMGLMLPPGQNLKDLLGEETWALFVEKVGEGTAKMMLPMKPAAAASAIAIQGIKMTMPMDLAVVSKAQEAKLPIHYLEDAAFQLAMLDEVMTVDTVREMLTSPDATDMKTMLQTYRNGDDAALIKEMQNTSALGENGEEKMEALLFKRNENWIPKLEELFATKGAFVAVGAAHLLGPRSVVDLLAAKGYTITRFAKQP